MKKDSLGRSYRCVCRICGSEFWWASHNKRMCKDCCSETKLCECGCGTEILRYDFRRNEKRYVQFHHMRVVMADSEEKAKRVKYLQLNDSEVQRRRAIGQWTKEKRSQRSKELVKLWEDSEYRERMSGPLSKERKLSISLGVRAYVDSLSDEERKKKFGNSGSSHPHWKGGYSAGYGPNWHSQRDDARTRDVVCQKCGASVEQNNEALSVHHIVPFADFEYILGTNQNYLKANRLSNLVCFCRSCHISLEWTKGSFDDR